jgi:Putative binding domain, N-terminal/Viral BACON domain
MSLALPANLPMLLRPAVERVAPLFLAAAIVAGCETSSTLSASPTPVKCVVSLGAPPIMDAGGGSGSLVITTQPECAWDVATNVNWISVVSPASGQGTADVSFRVAANDGASLREGMISVNGEQARVSQRAPCRYEVGPTTQNVSSTGGAVSLTISTAAECAWTAVPDVAWISLTSSAAGSGNGTVRFAVVPNDGAQRTGSIGIANQRAIVTQTGASAPPPACSPTVSPASQNIGAAGGAGAPVNVSAPGTCQWTATSNAPWITVMSGATGTGNGSVTFSVAANTGAARTGTLTIGGQAFTVTQSAGSGSPPPPSPPAPAPPAPPSCTYSISPSSDNVGVLGGARTVTVSTTNTCSWTAASNATWIAVTSGATGTGNGGTGYLVEPNIGAARSGTLTIAGRPFTVSQAAVLPCTYSISPTSQEVRRNAGTDTIQVSTSGACSWTASSNTSWITVTSGASGTGNGTVTFSFTQNNGSRRTGSLTVAGRTATVEQRGDNGNNDDDDD